MRHFFIALLALMVAVNSWAQQKVLEARIRSNIYLNVYTNKTSTYVGEPIIVTYKLYSSLESVSEITKEPAFTGFDVKDLVHSGEGAVSRETVDGEVFDVHTLRKVQLTPVAAGEFKLDAMVVGNRVQLLDASGNPGPLLEGIDDNIPLRNGEYRMSISSVPITIQVNEGSGTTKPAVYNGAVGDFKMHVAVSRVNFSPGEKGTLQITISGVGDFSQVQVPHVEWPKDIAAGTANVLEKYDRSRKINPGSKVFTIPFTVGKSGSYTILPIAFSYFDSKLNRSTTITNPPVTFYSREGTIINVTGKSDTGTKNEGIYKSLGIVLVGLGIAALLLMIGLLIRSAKHRKRRRSTPVPKSEEKIQVQGILTTKPKLSIDELLSNAEAVAGTPGAGFYTALKQALLRFFEQKYGVAAALFNKGILKDQLIAWNVSETAQNEVLDLLAQIEMHIYSAGSLNGDHRSLLQKTRTILGRL